MTTSRPVVTQFLGLSLAVLATMAFGVAAAPQSTTAPVKPPATAARSSAGQCGYLSTGEGIVPKSDNVFVANITQIDGRSTSFMKANRQKVAVGSHTLTISEQIDERRFNEAQLFQVRKMKDLKNARAYKKLVVDVKAGMSYRIGAKLDRDKLDTASIRANAYWEPVIWEQVAEACP